MRGKVLLKITLFYRVAVKMRIAGPASQLAYHSRGMIKGLKALPSALTAVASLPGVVIRPCGYGMRRPASLSVNRSKGMKTGFIA
jgi:hypothetical protein